MGAHRRTGQLVDRRAERVELAGTALPAIADADPLPPWVAVSSTGRLAPLHAPVAAHDVAYRLARHAGTMTADIYRAAADQLGELPYVELCRDRLDRRRGGPLLPQHRRGLCRRCPHRSPVPRPASGPSRSATGAYNWVPVAAPADEIAAVVQAYTAVPASSATRGGWPPPSTCPTDEMVDPDWRRRPGGLSRAQMELVAARLTLLRDCFY